MEKGYVGDSLVITKLPEQSEIELRTAMGSFEYLFEWTKKMFKALFDQKPQNKFQRNVIEVCLRDKEEKRDFLIQVMQNRRGEILLDAGWCKNGVFISKEITLDEAQFINNRTNMNTLEMLLDSQRRRVITGEYFNLPNPMKQLGRFMDKNVSKEYVHKVQHDIVKPNQYKDNKRDGNSR